LLARVLQAVIDCQRPAGAGERHTFPVLVTVPVRLLLHRPGDLRSPRPVGALPLRGLRDLVLAVELVLLLLRLLQLADADLEERPADLGLVVPERLLDPELLARADDVVVVGRVVLVLPRAEQLVPGELDFAEGAGAVEPRHPVDTHPLGRPRD